LSLAANRRRCKVRFADLASAPSLALGFRASGSPPTGSTTSVHELRRFAMSANVVQDNPVKLNVLGHYSVRDEARVLIGRRIEGKVYVYDYPQDGRGRRYFVEAGFESKAELAVLLADYRREAARLGACPMSCEATERRFEFAVAA
jgi:hypothetical protein